MNMVNLTCLRMTDRAIHQRHMNENNYNTHKGFKPKTQTMNLNTEGINI